MEKSLKIVLIGIIIILIGVIWMTLKDFIIDYFTFNPVIKSTMTGVVVKVNENSLGVMGKDDSFDLYNVGFTKEGNIGFKQGQEILIEYNGMIITTFPASPAGVTKIKILKDKSDVEIPDDVLRFYYSSKDNVKINVSEITNKGMTWNIIDTNELPYEYSSEYRIIKKGKNTDYTGIGYKIGENTKNSTAGYTRNRTGVYMGRIEEDIKYII